MTNKTKVISAALSAALAASSFAAFAVTASAADETFDAVRVTYGSETTEEATLTVGGKTYLIPAGTVSTVVTVDENTEADVKVDITGNTKPAIELLEYKKLDLSGTTAPYMNYSWYDCDDFDTVTNGDVNASQHPRGNGAAGRHQNLFNGMPADWTVNLNTVLCALYKPNVGGVYGTNVSYTLNFDLGDEMEIAKMTLYTNMSTSLTSSYTIGTIQEAESHEDSKRTDIKTVNKTDFDTNSKFYQVDGENKARYLDTEINTKTDRLQIKFFGNDSNNNPIMASIYELELYTYDKVKDVDLSTTTSHSTTFKFTSEGEKTTFTKVTATAEQGGKTDTETIVLSTEITLEEGEAYLTITEIPAGTEITTVTID